MLNHRSNGIRMSAERWTLGLTPIAAALLFGCGLAAPGEGAPVGQSQAVTATDTAKDGRGDGDAGIVKPDHKYRGLTYGQWQARWWQWAFSVPVLNGNDHPIFPQVPGGDVLRGNSGDVFFLAGVGGGEVRTVTIPEDTALFFPLVNAECSELEGPPFHGGTEAERRACAIGWIDGVTDLACEIDGAPVRDLFDYRTASPDFAFGPLPADNIFGLPGGGSSRSVDDGYYLMLKPLEVGHHTLHFKATATWFTFETSYDITIARRHR